VSANCTLSLSTGTYFFRSLNLGGAGTLSVDTRHGPVFLYLMSSITYQGHEVDEEGGTPRLFVGYYPESIEATGFAFHPRAGVLHDGG
jgi:hypothetical protein